MENELAKLCVWRECRSEPDEGITAVCFVILNRMHTQKKSSFDIVTAQLQFSSMTDKGDMQLAKYPSTYDPKFISICKIFDDVVAGNVTDSSLGATFYRNPKTSTSVWFESAVTNGKLEKTVTIGQHDFYKQA